MQESNYLNPVLPQESTVTRAQLHFIRQHTGQSEDQILKKARCRQAAEKWITRIKRQGSPYDIGPLPTGKKLPA